jgi:hypothetical protein
MKVSAILKLSKHNTNCHQLSGEFWDLGFFPKILTTLTIFIQGQVS